MFVDILACIILRTYHSFSFKGANFRICSTHVDVIIKEIKKQRAYLEEYIVLQPEFLSSLTPVDLLSDAPEVAVIMDAASRKTGIGPMASVAGIMAQSAAEAAVTAGAEEAIVENGGDIFLVSPRETTIGLYAGSNPISGTLAFKVTPAVMPVAVCSSSSKMGHSLSLGDCDLATVVAKSAALADSAATLACNLVKKTDDIDPALKRITAIDGISGLLLVKGDKIGLAGDLPELVKHHDADFPLKITRDKESIE